MRAVGRFVPALALMALGWWLSDTPDLSSGLPGWDTLLRKGAHVCEFALLWALWLWALGGVRATREGRPGPIVAATVIALSWAALDELHQTWVPGRHGSPVDWAIDAAGVGLAITLALRRLRPRARALEVAGAVR